uniref:2-dehydro-3-deoxyphosphooctonate aldolase n=1 Tax=Rhizophora mucronata TaxID=61149 RepID=A0A2P2JLB0_RHIMU
MGLNSYVNSLLAPRGRASSRLTTKWSKINIHTLLPLAYSCYGHQLLQQFL